MSKIVLVLIALVALVGCVSAMSEEQALNQLCGRVVAFHYENGEMEVNIRGCVDNMVQESGGELANIGAEMLKMFPEMKKISINSIDYPNKAHSDEIPVFSVVCYQLNRSGHAYDNRVFV